MDIKKVSSLWKSTSVHDEISIKNSMITEVNVKHEEFSGDESFGEGGA